MKYGRSQRLSAVQLRTGEQRCQPNREEVRGLDALEQAVYDRCRDDTGDLLHTCDRDPYYLSIRYTERLADALIEVSVGSRGDAYDHARRTVIGLFKAEVIRRCGPWRSLEAVEVATLDWVDWFNHGACSNRSGTCRRRNMKRATMSRPRWPDSR